MTKVTKNSNKSKPTAAKKTTVAKKNTKSSSGGGGPSAGTRILLAIAQQNSMGVKTPNRQDVCNMAGMLSFDSFRVTCNNLKKKGWIEHRDKQTIKLTKAGLEQVGPEVVAMPKTNDAMQAQIKDQLPGGKTLEIFELLLDGQSHSKAEIARALGYQDNEKSDSVRVFISKLSKFTEKTDGKIRLTDIAFPFGRPDHNKK